MSLKCYKVLLLAVVVASGASEVLEDGEVSVRLDTLEEGEQSWRARVAREGRRPPAPARVVHVTAMAPPEPECLYQYPQRKQVDAMLSNMMNELTKVFVRSHQLVTEQNNRNGEIKRFRVMKKKNMEFFEEVFKNMSVQFRRFSNREMLRFPPPPNTCARQKRLKSMWKDLLESSVSNVRRAALMCVAEYLRVQHRSNDGNTRRRLDQFLRGEMSRVRNNQLDMLCDEFQLCFSDLL